VSSDADLAKRILERDAHAFEVLLETHQGAILRHLTRITHDDTAAQDLVQETFLRVWTRTAQWDGRGSLKAWLYRIATNLALNHLRTVRRRREEPLGHHGDPDLDEEDRLPAWLVDSATPGPGAVVERAEEHERLQRLVHALPDDKRALLRLVHEMEMTVRDAAAELGIPEGTAKSRLHYAKQRLAHDWQATEGTWEE